MKKCVFFIAFMTATAVTLNNNNATTKSLNDLIDSGAIDRKTVVEQQVGKVILHFDNLDLTSLDGWYRLPKVFSFFPHDITTIDLSNNKLTHLTAGFLKKYKNLQILSLKNNELVYLPKKLFSRGVWHEDMKLQIIDLSNNKIAHIAQDAFSNLSHVKVLILSNNRLSEISKRQFNMPELKKLYVDYNAINIIEPKAFYGLENLILLNLSHNQISFLNSLSFRKNKKLVALYLNDNVIQKIPYNLFEKNDHLKLIDLRNNKLTQIDEEVFDEKDEDMQIKLDENIQIIPRQESETQPWYKFW